MNAFSEDLISAYLDGEVTAAERAMVERALAESADLRRLYSELQQLQADCRLLPRYSPPPTFSDQVVARIQASQPVSPAVRRPESRGAVWRSWKAMTAAALLAATLLLGLLYIRRDSTTTRSAPNSESQLATSAQNPPCEVPGNRGPQAPDLSSSNGSPPFRTELVANFRMPQYVVVLDLTITPLGQQRRVFESVLQANRIPLNRDLQVDESLEKAILASRFIGDAQPATSARQSTSERTKLQEIEMIHVRGPGKQLDRAILELIDLPRSRSELVAEAKMDLAQEPAEEELFKRLSRAVQIANNDVSAAPCAQRLVFRFSLLGAARGFGTFASPLLRAKAIPQMPKMDAANTRAPKASSVMSQGGVAEKTRDVGSRGPGDLTKNRSLNPNDNSELIYEFLAILRNMQE